MTRPSNNQGNDQDSDNSPSAFPLPPSAFPFPPSSLSIVIACYDEERTLATLLDRVLGAPLGETAREVLVVDDGSVDESFAIAEEYARRYPKIVKTIRLPENRGKGAALRTAFRQVTGDIVIIQDADLEYDPKDFLVLLAKFEDPEVKVVYGSRILGSSNRSYHRYYWGGRLLSFVTNFLYGSELTDEPTCYKVFRRELLEELELQSDGFEICAELTARFLRHGCRIHEVPIRYTPRSFEEGKKISWRDGLKAICTLFRLRNAECGLRIDEENSK